MTCIAAVVDPDGTIHMAADSMSVVYTDNCRYGWQKIVKHPDMLIGVCGSAVTMSLLRAWTPPVYEAGHTPLNYMIEHFLPEYRELLACNDLLATEPDSTRKDKIGSDLLVGLDGTLFDVTNAVSVNQSLNEDAVGSGYSFATASLYTTRHLIADTAERVRLAVETACVLCPTVGGEVYVASLPPRSQD